MTTALDFSQLTAKDVLICGALPQYERGMKIFYRQLFELNTNIYIVERIREFPFDLFFAPRYDIFFRTVARNFVDAGILAITRLATDTKGDVYTLTRFKNRVLEITRPEYKTAFQERLRRVSFDKETQSMLKRARAIRDGRIAHAIKEPGDASLSFRELGELRDTLNSLLNALSFNVEYMMLPPGYDPRVQYPVSVDHKPDIERLLDCVARDSTVFNAPESDPYWERRKHTLNDRQINQLNRYRKKFGLPEV